MVPESRVAAAQSPKAWQCLIRGICRKIANARITCRRDENSLRDADSRFLWLIAEHFESWCWRPMWISSKSVMTSRS